MLLLNYQKEPLFILNKENQKNDMDLKQEGINVRFDLESQFLLEERGMEDRRQ